MNTQQIVMDALAEKITALEQRNLDTIKKWDSINSASIMRNLDHIDCFIQSKDVDIQGFIECKQLRIDSLSGNERSRYIVETLDILEYLHSKNGDSRLMDFYDSIER